MIGMHLQDRWIKNKETWIDDITRDVRKLLKTAEWMGISTVNLRSKI
jgi:hypothetical protein